MGISVFGRGTSLGRDLERFLRTALVADQEHPRKGGTFSDEESSCWVMDLRDKRHVAAGAG